MSSEALSAQQRATAAIAATRRAQHERRMADQHRIERIRKWAPVILELMNRKRFAASRIVRFMRRHWFYPQDRTIMMSPSLSQSDGDHLVRFRLTIDKIDHAALGIDREQLRVMQQSSGDDEIFPPLMVVFNATVSVINRQIEANGVIYTLTDRDVARFHRAVRCVNTLRCMQNLEYYRALAQDIASKH
jgi:hypothetical protein